ncbi:hypothetical protein GCM10009425_47960 [Pseudomonas asuensis]|uniref:Uncharacterized protein n=1 Tax=Pseudomonas asuensis TaxID=1825787 RepID=A0ABQ2H509_9PSED|nr:hypothetical protein GCM10009425_47960 [Pseudomonas asuensis]
MNCSGIRGGLNFFTVKIFTCFDLNAWRAGSNRSAQSPSLPPLTAGITRAFGMNRACFTQARLGSQ